MNCALLIIGDELLAGRTRDLNGHWLSTFLPSVGLSLQQIKIVNDSEEAIKSSLDELFNSVDIVMTSGGLGPTKDDITKNIIARYFNKELISDKESVLKAIGNNASEIKIYSTSKTYLKSREEEIFDMIKIGCSVSDGKIFELLKESV